MEEGNPPPVKKERPCSNTLTASEYEGSAKTPKMNNLKKKKRKLMKNLTMMKMKNLKSENLMRNMNYVEDKYI